jgi:predicted RNase H-like nuclease (RuvC/YqgF family)
MIDTDKYEGHTEGKWILGEYKGRPSISAVEDVETPTWMRSIARGLNPSQTADHALIADAPLLLAEVKRLQRDITMLENNLEHTRHRFMRSLERCTEVKESLLAEIKRLSLTVEDTGVMKND